MSEIKLGKPFIYVDDDLVRMVRSLELWKRLFECRDHPYWASMDEYMAHCFFCGKDYGKQHADNCIWIEAKKLVTGSEE